MKEEDKCPYCKRIGPKVQEVKQQIEVIEEHEAEIEEDIQRPDQDYSDELWFLEQKKIRQQVYINVIHKKKSKISHLIRASLNRSTN